MAYREEIAGIAHIRQHQHFKAFFGVDRSILQADDFGLIAGVAAHGVVKNGWVGGHAGNGILVNPAGQFT